MICGASSCSEGNADPVAKYRKMPSLVRSPDLKDRGIMICDATGSSWNILFVNNSWAQVTGHQLR